MIFENFPRSTLRRIGGVSEGVTGGEYRRFTLLLHETTPSHVRFFDISTPMILLTEKGVFCQKGVAGGAPVENGHCP